MLTSRLNDAAILLHLSLNDNGINYAVIGGFAITHFGGNRQTKDIDCIANASKEQIIDALDTEAGLVVVSQDRNDYVGVSWPDRPDRGNTVLIHIFCSVYPGARFPNALFRFETHEVKGDTFGNGVVSFHEPFYLFKAALRAAGARSNFLDSVDLRWLVQRYTTEIKVRRHKIHLVDVGRALKQHPNLEGCFDPLGIDITKAKIAAKDFIPARYSSQRLEDPPKGLFDSLADS
ncbi:uncharacterized protein N7458_007419 [Penicillium daleae]|uniref:Uncharacterized protein n=1 Tax=Penicillium daleae TaxID=63821 RepID=A0AAD6FZY0_9EURO|nr:uncharacterized protein N7458_007419 [Penicillium daleae]KAJ5443547.1 hypothetical protein N7458_007419 [Penicillium daleae]